MKHQGLERHSCIWMNTIHLHSIQSGYWNRIRVGKHGPQKDWINARVHESANTGLQTLQGSIFSLHASIVSVRGSNLSLKSFWILTLMLIRIQLFTLMRIRIQLPKTMRIHADLEPWLKICQMQINRDLNKTTKLRKEIHGNIEVDLSYSRKPIPGLRRKFQRCEHWSPLQ